MDVKTKPYDYNLKSIPEDIQKKIKKEQIRLIEDDKPSSIRLSIFSLIRKASKK